MARSEGSRKPTWPRVWKPPLLQTANPARIVIAEDKKRTYDMGGKASTLDVAKAIADYAAN